MIFQKLLTYLKKIWIQKYNDEGLGAAIKAIIALAGLGLSVIYLKFIRIQLSLMPAQALAIFKEALNPTTELDYGRAPIRLAADNAMSFQRSNACKKEPETVKWIEENLAKGEVFYDIGANVGAYSLVADKFCGGQVKVYAFEPSFSTFQLLCKNIILNKSQNSIFPFMVCLSEKEQIETLNYFSVDGGESKHTLGDNYTDCLGEKFTPEYQQSIFGFSIDTLVQSWGFPAPNLIKLDVDGTELDILKGAAETFRQGFVRTILVEVSAEDPNNEDILSFLKQSGFALETKVKHGATVISNLIFKWADQQ